jgi:hypothetical protein
MVVDLSKTPLRFFLACGMYCAFAVIVIMVFATAFTSGVTFGTPRDFAVDNEQRVYLSMQSGVFVSDLGTLRAIWPSTQNGYALSVSEDDLLTIADSLDVRVIDLAKSNPAAGQLEVVKRYSEPDNAFYSNGREDWKTDTQNGATYRYQGNSVYYEIFREENGRSELFFSMPRADYVWTLAAKIAFTAFIPYIFAGLLIWGFYFKRHPEYTKETTFRYPLSAPKKK